MAHAQPVWEEMQKAINSITVTPATSSPPPQADAKPIQVDTPDTTDDAKPWVAVLRKTNRATIPEASIPEVDTHHIRKSKSSK